MNTWLYFLRIAFQNLLRGGQRVFVALLCIIFGVMSLLGMLLVSQAFDRALILQPSEILGGDMSLNSRTGEAITQADLDALMAYQQSGALQRFTAIAYSSQLSFHKPGSGELLFASSGLGIDPAVYPLAGVLSISQPAAAGGATLLKQPGDVIVTRDLAVENDLHVGDALVLTDLDMGVAVPATLRGIASDTPNHQGSKIYYTLETAARLQALPPAQEILAANTVMANASDPVAASQTLEADGWSVTRAVILADSSKQGQDLMDNLLKGAGVLGLLVGGIGVANTMQVLLRRRQKEVAIWKALGYQESQLTALFVLEAALLGSLGSLLGAGLGLGICFQLLRLFERTGNLLVSLSISPGAVLLAIVVGILTTIIFALWAIVSVSQAQPMALLRNEAVEAVPLSRWKALGLALLLGLPFSAVTSLVMGSLLAGAGILLFAVIGLLVLGGVLALITWTLVRVLPLGALPLTRLAQTSLKRRGLGLVFAMIALFTGVVALGMGVIVTDNARNVMAEKSIRLTGANLQVLAPAGLEPAVKANLAGAAAGAGVKTVAVSYQTPVLAASASGQLKDSLIKPWLVGRSQPGDYKLSGAAWGSRPEGVYLYDYYGVQPGSQVTITFADGHTRSLPVVGAYDVDWNPASLPPVLGVLLPLDLFQQVTQPVQVTYYLRAPVGQLAGLSRSLGAALPRATVVNLQSYADRYTQTYHNLFVLALSMAGLALLAGVLLVANSVSLAMLDRRYEIGVLKSVGYSQGHILATLAVEYSLVAAIATAAGLAGVELFLLVIGLANKMAAHLLVLSLPSALWIGVTGVGLVLLTVLAVTWGPARVSPVTILNER